VTSITNQTYTGIYNPANLVSNVVNGPNGPISYSLGNGLSVNKTYDSLGRVNGSFLCQGSLVASCNGGTQIYGFTTYQVGVRLGNSCDTAVNQCLSYGYDEFNRLTTQTGPTSLSFVYDRWGNRTSQTVTQGGPAPSPSYGFNTSSNQIQTPAGFAYDAAGNLINDTVHTYIYDAEGNVLGVDGWADKYVYDALNHRVSQQTASGTYEYLYDPAGRRISRWNVSNNSGDEGRIYWDGNQIAFHSYDGTTYFENQDWLGTERMRTNYMGAKAMNYSSLPWGDGYAPTTIQSGGTPDQDTLHFAQLDYDFESGTEHAQFRQYSNTQGRWMSPDPYDGSMDIGNPQSFNRYAYVSNNPLRFTDPTGLRICNGSPADSDGPCTVPGGLGDLFTIIVDVFDIAQWFHHPQFKGSLKPRPSTPPGSGNCGIQVKCRGIEYRHLGLAGFQHCDARVTDSSGTVHSLSGGPDPPNDPLNATLNAWDTPNPTIPFTGMTVSTVNSCKTAGCLINSTDQYHNNPNNPHYDGVNGPNSNTWLKGTFAGCGVNLPINTYGGIW
jgi:RHS repeat-associated protein